MTELERRVKELQHIQNSLDVVKDMDEIIRLREKAQRLLDWLDSMPRKYRV